MMDTQKEKGKEKRTKQWSEKKGYFSWIILSSFILYQVILSNGLYQSKSYLQKDVLIKQTNSEEDPLNFENFEEDPIDCALSYNFKVIGFVFIQGLFLWRAT